MDKSVAKPLTIAKDEFQKNVVELCNTSGLPFFIIESVLKDLFQEIHILSNRQLEEDRMRYSSSLPEDDSKDELVDNI